VAVVGGIALFFLGMGVVALADPARITAIFGMPALTAEARNEVRAVYGGFGVAMAAVLFAALRLPTIRPGVLLCAAAALAGMAGGRIVAAAIERPRSLYPSWFYCALEALMAAALWASR
jgi:hypothetical protein